MRITNAFWKLFCYSCDKCNKLLDVVVGKITRNEHFEILKKHMNHKCEKLDDLHCKLCKEKVENSWRWCKNCGVWLKELNVRNHVKK